MEKIDFTPKVIKKSEENVDVNYTPDILHRHGATMYSVRDLYPLFWILVVILSLSVATVWLLDVMFMLSFMGWFFLVFGSVKILHIKAFIEAYHQYDLIAQHSKLYAFFFPFFEVLIGLSYLFMWQSKIMSGIVLVLMLVSAAGVAFRLHEGEVTPEVHMDTVFQIPMTWVTLGQNLLMAVMALLLLILPW